MPSMPYNYIPLYRRNLHFGLPAARRCGSIRIKSSTIQSNRKRAGKTTFSLENAQSFWLSLPFLDEILHLFTLSHTTQAAFSLSMVGTGEALETSWATSVQDCLILCIDVYCVCVRGCNTPLKYRPILWELTTCHATTTKTPTSKRPPIHHQKYHSNATTTSEK